MLLSQNVFSDALGYMPLSRRRVDRQTKILLCLVFLGATVLLWTIRYVRRPVSDGFGPPSNALDNYQRMCVPSPPSLLAKCDCAQVQGWRGRNQFPMIHEDYEKITPEERAVVSSIYTDSYVFPVAVLGYTLQQHHTDARRILIYLPDRLSNRTLCFLQAAGWELHPVELIPPPHGGKDIHYTFIDQYTKLNIWTLDQIGIKTAVYLDADTMVRRNFDEIWNLPFEFGAVPDIYVDDPGFTPGFNAGILLFHPSTAMFKDMVSKLETTTFRLVDAEQSFLNHYFGAQAVRLPYAYGGNIAIKERSPEMWQGLQKDLRIIHYTLSKPFDAEPKCPDTICGPEEIFDLERHEEWLEITKTKWEGHFAPELTWWEESFKLMMYEIGDLCPAS